ncbi:hypothetical protein XENORESO_019060 [Xenotaenia resolanae]|uniref:Uncharacterized protein n=1 Tax=Xenotaenia resolanae TaxID=208358 RepID=A0ABV0VMD9_9TELE
MPPPSWATAANQSIIHRERIKKNNMESGKKQKGGAERKMLSGRCVKITQMFAGGCGGESASAAASEAGADGGGGRQVEGKGRQEEERPAQPRVRMWGNLCFR